MCYIYSHIHLHVDRRDVHTYINWLARCRIYVRTRGQSAGRHSCKACNSCLYYARWSRCKGKPQQDDLSAQNDSQSRIKVLSVIIIFTSLVAKITSISSLSDKKRFRFQTQVFKFLENEHNMLCFKYFSPCQAANQPTIYAHMVVPLLASVQITY
jgi:hypothetical protein